MAIEFLKDKRKKRVFIALLCIVTVLAILFGACGFYLGDYYRADLDSIGAFLPQGTTIEEWSNGNIVIEPEKPEAGLILYPGGKVEYTAYIPLMQACAEKGILCVLVEMPFNLAVFDVSAADGIKDEYPAVGSWYIGGHSLGGSMAASYLSKHTEDFDGLVLLGSYSTADLSEADLEVLSVFGSEDGVLNREKYEECRANLPIGYRELEIAGGCHAYFGMYGAQDGDGTPLITAAEQISQTAEAIAEMVNK